MRRFLLTLLVLISLGLCGICTVQWRREFVLRARIDEVTGQLIAENKKRVEFEEKAQRFEEEITRLTRVRAETEAALLVATEQVQQLTADQSARGYSIAVLMNEAVRAGAELEALRRVAGAGSEAIETRNSQVAAQNAAIEKANAQLRQLAGERDDAIRRLNARTAEFNALVEKYNQLAKGAAR